MSIICSIVRDLLPLYTENLLRNDTEAFVKKHLAECCECAMAYKQMSEKTFEKAVKSEEEKNFEEAMPLKLIKKELLRRKLRFLRITAIWILIIGLLIYQFPIGRYFKHSYCMYRYTDYEIVMLISRGFIIENHTANKIAKQAEEALTDVKKTFDENKEKYGELAHIIAKPDRNAEYAEADVEVLSAHFWGNSGSIWVVYSYQAYDSDKNLVYGCMNVLSLWSVEKKDGKWIITKINEGA